MADNKKNVRKDVAGVADGFETFMGWVLKAFILAIACFLTKYALEHIKTRPYENFTFPQPGMKKPPFVTEMRIPLSSKPFAYTIGNDVTEVEYHIVTDAPQGEEPYVGECKFTDGKVHTFTKDSVDSDSASTGPATFWLKSGPSTVAVMSLKLTHVQTR